MSKENQLGKELQNSIKEKVELALDQLSKWGLGWKDCIFVGEVAFNLAGIPVVASHIEEFLAGDALPIEVYVDPAKYKGPRVAPELVQHPYKIKIPVDDAYKISKRHRFNMEHLLIADEKALKAPTLTVDLGEGKSCRVMEPLANLRFFAERTILRYSVKFAGEDKIKEWFEKLQRIKEVAVKVENSELAGECEKYIIQSREKWGSLLGRT